MNKLDELKIDSQEFDKIMSKAFRVTAAPNKKNKDKSKKNKAPKK